MQREFLYRKGRQADGSHRYVYFRHPITKALTPLPSDETSQAFEDQYGPLLRAVEGANDPKPARRGPPTLKASESRFAEGSIGWFIDEYLASKAFAKLSGNHSKRNTRLHCDTMRAHRIAVAMLHDLTPELVDHYTGEIAHNHAPSTADKHATLISNLWKLARTYECFKRGGKHNPTIGRVRHHEQDDDGHLIWPVEVIDKFDGWAEPYLRQYRMGLHYTGQRGGDVVKMKWADYERGKIFVTQEKTGEKLWISCPAPLRTMLDAMPRISDHIFTNSRGEPYGTASTLSAALRHHLRDCGFTGYTMHGLRKNAGVELALAGCTVPEIMAVLGHKSPKMAIFYVQQVNKEKLAETAAAKWDAHIAAEAAQRAEAKQRNVAARRQQIRTIGGTPV